MQRIEMGRLALVPDEKNTRFVLCELPDNRAVGWVNVVSETGELSVRVDADFRQMGYGTKAARAAVWFAFEKMDLDVVWARVDPANAPARKILDALGFIEYAGEWRLYHTDYLPGPEWTADDIAKPEEMGAFFDVRAEGYDAHMFSFGGGASYEKLGACIPETGNAIRILDIGCGTGIELAHIFKKAPNARMTCVDLSRGMLDLLVENYREKAGQIEVVAASYVDWSYPKGEYDLVISSNTMHHFRDAEKVAIYLKIQSSLRVGGGYIESDFIVDAWCEKQYEKRYNQFMERIGRAAEPGEFHIDIPFTIAHQTRLLKEAGFETIEVLDDSVQPRWSGAILRAEREKER